MASLVLAEHSNQALNEATAKAVTAASQISTPIHVLVAGADPLPEEMAALDTAFHRVLARDVAALRTQPPQAMSAMDGYAVRSVDATNLTARLKVIRETTDGFRIAEEDLKLRGEGDVLGVRQSGLPGYRIARPEVHGQLITQARDEALRIMKDDPKLKGERGDALRCLLYLYERDEAIPLIGAG